MPGVNGSTCSIAIRVNMHPPTIVASYHVKDIFGVMEKPLFDENKVYPKPKFLKLLQSVGAKGKAFNISEIINNLREYISSKKLYDPQKPWLVHCENDQLGKVFHRKQFTINDVRKLLDQNVTISNKSNSFDSNEDNSCDSDATEVLVSSMSDSDRESPRKMLPLDDIISSSTSEPINSDQHSASPLFRVKPSFLQILHTAGAKGDIFREKEIFRYLKHYVWSRHLFDPQRPWIFLCHNDRLADVFECEKFMIYDVPSLVAKYGIESPEYRPKVVKSVELHDVVSSSKLSLQSHSSGPGRMQSTPSDITSSTTDPETTTSAALLHMIKQEDSLNATTSSSPSTNFMLTLEMQDGNDVLSFESEEPVDDLYLEYEVRSNSSSFHASDSEDEQHEVMDMLVICQDSDVEFWADLSETGSESDVELSEADKWSCSNCHAFNSPIHRLCDRCWTLRPGWLPDQKKEANKKSKDQLKKSSKPSIGAVTCSEDNGDSEGMEKKEDDDNENDDSHSDLIQKEADNLLSTPPPSSNKPRICNPTEKDSQKSEDPEEEEEDAVSAKFPGDSLSVRNTLSNICYFRETDPPTTRRTRNQTRGSKRSLTSDSEESDYCEKLLKLSQTANNLAAPGVCLICSHNPRDASLIHGASGHQICCMECARKLKRRGNKCPVCRRTIQKVVRNYLT